MKDGYSFVRPVVPVVALLVFFLTGWSQFTHAQAPGIEPQAEKTLKRMTDYLGSLKQFSLRTQVTLEDLLDSGHRVDFDISARVIVSRPNKLRADRRGDIIDQSFYYDGKTLTLHNPSHQVYATEPAPGTIEEALRYADESLGLIIPSSDLVHRNAFQLLMQDVKFAVVVGKAVIGGVRCDHLLFSRPDVDFQVWVAEGNRPLPYKYVVTDRGSAGRISITTVMSDWNVAPGVTDDKFKFIAPKGAKPIIFMRLDTTSGTGR